MATVSDKTIGRLVVYRRILNDLAHKQVPSIHSQDLAQRAQVTAAQVRRDLMGLGCFGTPTHGYDVAGFLEALRQRLDAPQGQTAALVGAGNLGRAILAYFAGRRPKLAIVAAFDNDPAKAGRAVRGCPVYPLEDLGVRAKELKINLGIITVPEEAAQAVAEALIAAGIRGIVNFAPARLRVPAGVYVEDIDITTSLEKVAYFARRPATTPPRSKS